MTDQLQQTLNLCHQAQKARKLHAVLQILSDGNGRKSNPRYDDVFEASSGTLDWVLLEPQKIFKLEQDIELTFVDWLRGGKGIFHVIGKPGAGKSILMKFIWDHNITKAMLKEWAGGSKLLCMKYFFWKPEPGQSGLRGFKSSLMSSMLEQAPSLLDTLAPEPMGDCISYEQLSQAFDLLLKSPQTLDAYRVFLLIDGLDEFDEERNPEDHHDLVRLIQTWASQSEGKVKICVSSREYEAFIAMERHQKMTLQNLTRKDIKTYVTERLKSHPRFPQLREYCQKTTMRLHEDCGKFLSNACDPDCLVEHIVSVSDGVFLWVRLVMVQVRKCLSADINLHNIWEHVDSQPKPLTDFIKHMLNTILPLHQRQAYILLSIMHRYELAGKDIQVPLGGASYLCNELDQHNATSLNGRGVALQEAESRILTQEEIIARFNGLIEVSDKNYLIIKLPILIFSHRSIVEILRDNLDAKLMEHDITQIELGTWACHMALRESNHFFKFLSQERDNLYFGNKYLRVRLLDFLLFLRDRDLFKDPSVPQLLDLVEDTCLTLQLGSGRYSDQHWEELSFKVGTHDFYVDYFSFLGLTMSFGYVEALPWILKVLSKIPKRGHLVYILLWECMPELLWVKNWGRNTSHVFLMALLERGFIGIDLIHNEQDARAVTCGYHTAKSWIAYVRRMLKIESQNNNDWAIVELWLDRGANPRIYQALGELYANVEIDGKWRWIKTTRRGYLLDFESHERDDKVMLRDFIARSDAPNKARLLELVDRNEHMIEVGQAADVPQEALDTSEEN